MSRGLCVGHDDTICRQKYAGENRLQANDDKANVAVARGSRASEWRPGKPRREEKDSVKSIRSVRNQKAESIEANKRDW